MSTPYCGTGAGAANAEAIDALFRNPVTLNGLPSFSRPPVEFVCPISKSTMKTPVQSLATGINYEKTAIEVWRSEHGDLCPVTGLCLGFLIPNQDLLEKIQCWRQNVKGLRRIRRKSPTTFCLVDSSPSCSSLSAYSANQISNVSSNCNSSGNNCDEKPSARRSDEAFREVDALLSSFVDAGISDYRHRVGDAQSSDGSDIENSFEEDNDNNFERQSRYTYNMDFYPSIFRHGPRFAQSRSI